MPAPVFWMLSLNAAEIRKPWIRPWIWFKPGGKIMIVGIPEMDKWAFDVSKGRRKEITFIHARRQNGTVQGKPST